jgi:hypothetical protein
MMPARHHHNNHGAPALNGRYFNNRIPPAWSLEQETTYSFRSYVTVIALWIMLTDLQAHQQRAAIIMRLGGSAREMAPQEMELGGQRNRQLARLVGALHARFASLEEESRPTNMTEMLAFNRRPGENLNSLLARYETVRQRAAVEGQAAMNVERCAMQLLRAVGIQPQHLLTGSCSHSVGVFRRRTSSSRR